MIGFEYNGSKYYYGKTAQGDVVRIYDAWGEEVVMYTYNAWGKVLSVTGSLAGTVGEINPFRYRSYYYDLETGIYYLNSRYYDPEVGRFLNADGFLGANGGILGYNLFAYCNNNPVMGYDPSGAACVYVNWKHSYNPDIMTPFLYGGSGGSSIPMVGASNRVPKPTMTGDLIDNIKEDYRNFSWSNTSEQVVLDAHYFSMYKGHFVFKINGRRSGSFGALFITKQNSDLDTVRHEYGHTQ